MKGAKTVKENSQVLGKLATVSKYMERQVLTQIPRLKQEQKGM
jgi:hypothetical protein